METRKMNRIALFIFVQCLMPVNADTDIRYLNCTADPKITNIIAKIEKSIIKKDFFELYDFLAEEIRISAPSFTVDAFTKEQKLNKTRLRHAVSKWRRDDVELYHPFGVLYDSQYSQHYFNTVSYSKEENYNIDVFLWGDEEYSIYISKNVPDLTTVNFFVRGGKIITIRSDYFFHGEELPPIGYGYYPNVYVASDEIQPRLSPDGEVSDFTLKRNTLLGNSRDILSENAVFIFNLPDGQKGFVSIFDTALIPTSVEPQAWPADLETEAFMFMSIEEIEVFKKPSYQSELLALVPPGKKFYRAQTHNDNDGSLDWLEIGNWYWVSESEEIVEGWIKRKGIRFLFE